jgi:hypothetical protein
MNRKGQVEQGLMDRGKQYHKSFSISRNLTNMLFMILKGSSGLASRSLTKKSVKEKLW